jgi:hypothetical protein
MYYINCYLFPQKREYNLIISGLYCYIVTEFYFAGFNTTRVYKNTWEKCCLELTISQDFGLSATDLFLTKSRPAKSHDFWCFLTISRLSPQISRFSELMKSSKSATSSYNKAYSSKETSYFISVLIMRNIIPQTQIVQSGSLVCATWAWN